MTIYTIIVNSANKLATSTTTNATYNFDFSVLPENKKYKMSFAFVSDSVNVTSYTSIALVSITLGQDSTYSTSANSTYATSSNLVGCLEPYALSTTAFLIADNQVNNPIYLKHRPHNNQFNVLINGHLTGAPWIDNALATITSYVLTLTFECIED